MRACEQGASDIDYFVVCHDEAVVMSMEGSGHFAGLPGHRWLFVGDGPCDVVRGWDNVIICRELPVNIEERRRLLTFTAWYAVAANRLSRCDDVCILEYDVDLSAGMDERLREHAGRPVGFVKTSTSSIYFLDVIPEFDAYVSARFGDMRGLFAAKGLDSWASSSNFKMPASVLRGFVSWYAPMVDDIYNMYRMPHFHERAINLYCALNDIGVTIIEDLIRHWMSNSHSEYV